ncbi:MAG: orotidine-5'-phosphate decarboxylase [Gemmatimonadetes bacterium]|nr:orotidine-5'-phosphate decarboxylase [Gemmatimonadota bacterium]
MANLIVALDLPTRPAALELVGRLHELVTYYKVGAPLFTRVGPDIVRELRERGKRVFLDLKYHDIPSTVARAVEAAAALDVDLLTLHASGGSVMLRAARAAVASSGPRLLGVTALTSSGPDDLEQAWGRPIRSVGDEVNRLALLAAEAGLDGVVASPREAQAIKRRHGSDFLVVTPGIRPAHSARDDQARTATPAFAVRAGADFLVVGRPILEAEHPAAVAGALLEEMRAETEVLP